MGRDVEMSQAWGESSLQQRKIAKIVINRSSCLGLRYIQEPIIEQPRPGLTENFLENTETKTVQDWEQSKKSIVGGAEERGLGNCVVTMMQ